MDMTDEIFDVERKRIALNVVGKIDIDSMNTKTRPAIGTSYTPTGDWIISIPARDEIEKKLSVWHPDWKALRKHVPALCYEYTDGYPLRVKLKNGETAYAIGRLDPLKQTAGYYIAINLYGQGVITKMSDHTMDDGVKAGEWNPETIQSVNKATNGERDIINSLLLPQIEKEREFFREMLVQEFLDLAEEQARRIDEQRRQREEEEREREKKEAIQRLEEEKARLADEEDRTTNDIIPDDVEYDHLPLSRCQKTLRNSNWPRVDAEIPDSNYFVAMQVLASLFEQPVKTYILSRTYVGFCYHEMKEQLKDFSTVRNLLGESESRRGVLCFQKKLMGELRDFTVPYAIGSHAKSGTEYIRFAIIIDGQMYGTYTHSRKNAVTQPFVTHNRLLSPKDYDFQAFDMKEYSAAIINLIISHIMMEQRTEAMTNENDDDNDNKATVPNASPLGADILLRTKAWYNSVTIPSTEVAPYESHRWKGSGENKTLEPVTVSGYTKGAYTRAAQCEK